MDKAFDVIFKRVVDAAVVAKTSYRNYGDRFRYHCLYCGEEVYLAAAESYEVAPHFRHRRGNNDTDCEIYLGQPGVIEQCVSIRKHNKERVSFYFNKDRMTFEICVFFTEEELKEFELNKSKMTLYAKYNSQPFFNLPLRRDVITSNQKNYFTVNEYSNEYYVSFDNGIKKYFYPDIMKKDGRINVFKAGSQKERCKRVLSNMLYTDNEYVAISENKENIHNLLSMESSISVNEEFSFVTGNVKFYGALFSIKYADYSNVNFFRQHEYQIEMSESFDILWPPVFMKNSKYISSKDEVYVTSSFELIPHGNIDVDSSCIETVKQEIQKITFDDNIFIYEKNVDICIERDCNTVVAGIPTEPEIAYSKKYIVPSDYDYFLFDKDGCTRLVPGSVAYLCESDKIVGYKNGHIKVFIYGCKTNRPTSEVILADILKYAPQTENFNPDDFMSVEVDETIATYLEECYRSRKINSVVKRYIKEGLI